MIAGFPDPFAYVDDAPLEPEDVFSAAVGDTELDPGPIAARLVRAEKGFTHLREGEAAILFLMRHKPKEKGGRAILGEMCLPKFGGTLGSVGLWLLAKLCDGTPDYVMVLDANWWVQAAALQREALVFHELEHAVQATDKAGELRFDDGGKPVWDIRAHSLEEFDSVVQRYGAWSPDIVRFLAACRKGGAV